MTALPHQNLTRRFVQLAGRNSWLPSLLARLTRLMVLGSLLLAIAPQGCATLLPDRERSSLQEAVPLYNVLRKRRGWGADGELGTKGEQFVAQRKTACCNCSTWCNRRMGSSACATSVSSCCISTGRTPERSSQLTRGLRLVVDVAHFHPVALFGQQFHGGLKTVEVTSAAPGRVR